MTEALRGLFHFSKNWTEGNPDVLQVRMLPANSNSHGALMVINNLNLELFYINFYTL